MSKFSENGVVFDMLPEVELVHLAPVTGFQMFFGTPQPRAISFMQVSGVEKNARLHQFERLEKHHRNNSSTLGRKTFNLTTIDGYTINVFE